MTFLQLLLLPLALIACGESDSGDEPGKDTWPYYTPFYLILNVAWGGDWGGYAGVDDNALPVDMEVDYVRVFQKP